jgi:hypothetical protein
MIRGLPVELYVILPPMHRSCCVALLALFPLLIAAGAPAPGGGGGRGEAQGQGDLRLKAAALEVIYDLEMTPDQLRDLQKLAQGAAGAEAKHDRYPQALRKALNEWCDALAKGEDDKVDELQEKVEQQEDEAKLDAVDIDATDAAKKRAPEAMKLITAGQLANLIAMHSGDIQGPAETLIDSMEEVRGDDADYKQTKDAIVADVLELASGYGTGNASLTGSVGDFLDRVHKLSDGEYKSKQKDLEQEAHKIVGKVDAVAVVQHWAQRELAELISNPELDSAAKERLAAQKAKG